MESRGELATAEVLERASPVARRHVSFHAHYPLDVAFTPISSILLSRQLPSKEVSKSPALV